MKKGLITSILVLTFGGLQAQPLPATPKLVVTLTVDQLRTDYMEAFSSLYGEQGFKRLLREGRVFSQMELPLNGQTGLLRWLLFTQGAHLHSMASLPKTGLTPKHCAP